jgi:Protein of unknown function (DUF1479)
MLSDDQVATFRRDGVLVVPHILSPDELTAAHRGLSASLWRLARVDTANLAGTGHGLTRLSSTNGSGGVLDVFYEEWTCRIATHPRLWQVTTELWRALYSHDHQHQHHNVDVDFQQGYCYLDRIGYRLPTALATQLGMDLQQQQQQQQQSTKKKKNKSLAIQRSLTPHLDCCPETFHHPHKSKSKWRPIQCFVSLVDTLQPNQGGLEAALGFHHDFEQWSRTRPPTLRHVKPTTKGTPTSTEAVEIQIPAPCLGEYTHIRPVQDAPVMQRIQHVQHVTAGSAVFFDNRIPHANSYRHDGDQPRSVVYCSFLPNVALNQKYAIDQLDKFQRGIYPNDQWIRQQVDNHTNTLPNKDDKDEQQESTETDENDKDHRDCDQQTSKPLPEWLASSPLARKLMAIDPW